MNKLLVTFILVLLVCSVPGASASWYRADRTALVSDVLYTKGEFYYGASNPSSSYFTTVEAADYTTSYFGDTKIDLDGVVYTQSTGRSLANVHVSASSYKFLKGFTVDGSASNFNEAGGDYDFKIEGDTDTALFYVDAGNDRIGISTSTPATAFEVQGTSTVDAITIGGAVSQDAGAVAFNEAGADYDFKVEGDTEASLLYVNAGTDNVGIGTNAPTATSILDAAGTVEATCFRIEAASTPGDSTEVGVLGEMKFDADYIYIYTTDGWERVAIAAW